MKSKLSQLKALVPFLTLTTLTGTAASADMGQSYDCQGAQTQFGFFTTEKEDTLLVINNFRTKDDVYWDGSFSTYGDGIVTSQFIDVLVTTRYTGSDDKIKLGKLKGTKVDGYWKLEFTPADPLTGKTLKGSKQVLLCQEN
ncbi:MAG: hypothetical protein A2622_12745 [Bdellovibrionales bacterium RIFCSPHIGHO2_01_FULL_40_29]|nr:MAG: hypothetical protein A2622_12745 [Bdellovibrionales bacterium RIFCSPHIGHO2_01_FULL_40_29]OFZ33437.1 MAG: hypothetical protein A3D17_14140 [Bdellovibrionales bacterium RIFCSPHIGHO2_02_FULL_40_15]